ncbi:CHAT domain-containing protein [Zobellia roscoffensis]|uniref:CHAT domain-containing protein n=1 Tax=Zobellia roscoffensis TaxID=2779508 RepID=UPI00188CF24A|nr:CHAT domain-containing protein [Zobellia roscoffensis]
MKKLKHLTIFFLLMSFFVNGQQDQLLGIINDTTDIEVKQKKIDSFFGINKNSISSRLLADCYHDIGFKWYYRNWHKQGNQIDINKAIRNTQQALEIKKTLDSLEKGSLEKSMYNLGYFLYLDERYYDAIAAYQDLVRNGHDLKKIQNANRELGELHEYVGDFYKALDRYDNYIENYKNQNDLQQRDILNLSEIHILKAEIYSLLGNKEFSENIEKNLKTADSILLSEGYDREMHNLRINSIWGNQFAENKEYEKAEHYYNLVLRDSVLLDSMNLAKAFNMISIPQLKLNNYDTSIKNLQKAIGFDPNYSDPYENLGDLYLAKKDFKNAMYNYQKAIVWSVDKKNKIDSEELPAIEDLELATEKTFLLGHIVAKANAWLSYFEHDQNKEHLIKALQTFTLADKLVDVLRSESTEYQSKLFWREKGASLYMKAVEACYLLDKPREAYYFMERNKALLLLENISNEQAKETVNIPDSIAQRDFDLKKAIYLSESDLQHSNSTSLEQLKDLKERVYTNKLNYNTFTDSIATMFPEYASMKKKVSILPYPEFKKKYTSQDEVVLQYILNDEQGYALLTTGNDNQFFKLENVKELNQDIIQLYGRLTNLTMDRAGLVAYNQLSNSVFSQLIPEDIYTKVKGKKLTIISDHILQQIPFEAFVVGNNPTTRYLIEDVEVRYAYSMSYLDAKSHISSSSRKDLYAIAPIQFASLGLPELVFSGSEIEEVQKIFPGNIALKDEATKSAFVNNFEDYRIVHLSTHADVGQSEDPWIAFNDDKMFLNEIYATKNQAEMVVLSACNTSIGELKKGEGAMSLARGFFHSGAKSVVSSLWSTYDKSSKELMTAFYKSLKEGSTKSAAMRNAKLDYIKKYRESAIAPAYWSALIVIGDNSPIDNQSNLLSFWPWVVLGVLLLVILYFIVMRKKKKQ